MEAMAEIDGLPIKNGGYFPLKMDGSFHGKLAMS